MLFLLTISVLVGLLAAAGLAALASRRRSLLDHNRSKNLPEPSFRPLFEPGPEELRAARREKDARAAAAKETESRAALGAKLGYLDDFRRQWRSAPTRKATVELLYLASQCESGKVYSDAAHEAARFWKNGQIRGLSANDLSQLLESHLWLLPAGERTSGVSFSIQHEIADLRSASQKENK